MARGIPTLNPSTKMGLVVSAMPWPLYHCESNPVPTLTDGLRTLKRNRPRRPREGVEV